MKKLILILVSLVMVVSLVAMGIGCAKEAPTPTPTPEIKVFEWRFSSSQPTTSLRGEMYQEFADLVAKRTNGVVIMTMYPSSTLFDPAATFRALVTGDVEIAGQSTVHYEQAIPLFKMFGYPFVGMEGTDVRHVLRPGSRGREIVDAVLADFGIKMLCIFESGTAGLVSYEPIPTAESFRGVKVRTSTVTVANIIRELGAETVSMPGSEAVGAMQRRIVDASTIQPEGVISRGYWDFAKYYQNWDMFVHASTIPVSIKAWNELPANIQQIIWDTAQEIEAKGDKANIEAQDIALERMTTERQMGIILIDPSEKAIFKKIGEPLFEKDISALGPEGRELWQLLMNYAASKVAKK